MIRVRKKMEKRASTSAVGSASANGVYPSSAWNEECKLEAAAMNHVVLENTRE